MVDYLYFSRGTRKKGTDLVTQTAWVSHCPDWNIRGRWAKASMAKSRNPLAGVKGSNTLIRSAPWIPWKPHYLRFSFVAFFPLIVQFTASFIVQLSRNKNVPFNKICQLNWRYIFIPPGLCKAHVRAYYMKALNIWCRKKKITLR